MAIDWKKMIIVRDEDTVNVICGKEILYAKGLNGRGITSIAKTGISGLVDTYTITYTDGTTSTYTIKNGRGIVSVSKTGTVDLVDTYTIQYSDGTTSTYNITNGQDFDNEIIAEEFDTQTAYSEGDYVIYDGKLYKFVEDHPAGAWNASHVDEVSITDELKQKADELKQKADCTIIAPSFDSGTHYDIDDYVVYDGKLYQFISEHQIGAWDSSEVTEKKVTEIVGSGSGDAVWGHIAGTLSNQTDLSDALDAKVNVNDVYSKSETDTLLADKADTADLGDLASKDQAAWSTDISGIPQTFPPSTHNHDDRYYTESETDSLLAEKADTTDLGDLAYKDKVNWDSDIDNIPQTFPPSSHTHDDRYYTETETDTLLGAKANSADLGALAGKDQAAWDTDISGKPSTFPPSSHNHDDRYYTESEIDNALKAKADSEAIADEFVPGTAYSSGSLVTHEGRLYKANQTVAAKSWWEPSEWDETTVEVRLSNLSSSITTLTRDKFKTAGAAAAFDPMSGYDPGDVVTYNNLLYRCLYPTSGAWNASKWTEITLQSEIDDLTSVDATKLDFVAAAPKYTGSACQVGDVVSHDGRLYRCISATSGTWDASKFQETSVKNWKQDKLTFDDAPAMGSANPVKSGGVYSALAGKADLSHVHGNVSNAGAITSDTAIANGDKLVVTDASDSSKLIRTGAAFDGSTATKALTQKGTFEPFAAPDHTHDDRYYTESETDTLLAAKANTADLGALAGKDQATWDTDISGKPSTFPPSSHTHDERYYTESETDTKLAAKANTADLGALAGKDQAAWDTDISGKPSTFPPSSHTHDDRYYTESEMNTKLAAKANSSHTHNYAGSSSAGGSANSSNAIVPVNASSSDLNTLFPDNTTWYYAGGNNSATNGPIGVGPAFGMVVFRTAAGFRTQIFFGNDGALYKRTGGSTSTWGNWVQIKITDTQYTANTDTIGSASAGAAIKADDITEWNAGSVPTLGEPISATKISAWNAGSTPTLGTAIPADDITAWSAGAAAGMSVANGVLTFTPGSAPSLSYTPKSIPNVTSVGSAPSLTKSDVSIPNVTDVGAAPSLSYTEKTIPNISVTQKTVATGITAS